MPHQPYNNIPRYNLKALSLPYTAYIITLLYATTKTYFFTSRQVILLLIERQKLPNCPWWEDLIFSGGPGWTRTNAVIKNLIYSQGWYQLHSTDPCLLDRHLIFICLKTLPISRLFCSQSNLFFHSIFFHILNWNYKHILIFIQAEQEI